jgi:hypothetical protein
VERQLKVTSQIFETFQDQQATIAGYDLLLLQNPGVSVPNEDGVQARFQRRVDFGFRTVADHPGSIRGHAAVLHKLAVGRGVFLLHDGGVAEEDAPPPSPPFGGRAGSFGGSSGGHVGGVLDAVVAVWDV